MKNKIIKICIVILLIVIFFLFLKKDLGDIKNVAVDSDNKTKYGSEIITGVIEPEIIITDTNSNIPEPEVGNDTTIEEIKNVSLEVPFTSQAPFGNWKDLRQENGCEEAAALMAVYWAEDKTLTKEIAEKEIINVADYEFEKYGSYVDTSSEDTILRIFNEYFNFFNVEVKYNITVEDIISELQNGKLVLVPTNGQKLNNPFYTPPGATHHELVIKGYDKDTNEFITNDPGTRMGESYRYKTGVLFDAIYDYKTGDNEKVDEIIKAMIIVKK